MCPEHAIEIGTKDRKDLTVYNLTIRHKEKGIQ